MPTVNINKLATEAKGLTQATAVKSRKNHLSVSDAQAPQVFTHTFMASLTGDFLYELGTGDINPTNHTRMLLQYAQDVGRTMTEVAEEFLSFLMRISYSPETFRTIIASIVGTGDKPIGKNRIPSVTPTFVLAQVRKQLTDAPDIMSHMVSDYVCHMLKPLGWITPDNSYTYRMKRSSSFPDYDDLIDVVSALEIMKVFTGLADADLSLIHKEAQKNSAVSPSMVANELSNAMVTAHGRTRGHYDAEAVVRSVLTTMGRIWSPYTPDALYPEPRVANTSAVNDLRANLSIFLAYQDMVGRKNLDPQVMYGQEEMQTIILPFFMEAMATVSPFRRQLLSDVASFMGKKSSEDHNGQPDHIVLFEDWDFASEISAFVPVKQTALGEQRYLDVQQHISSALSSAMRPIRSSINVGRMVEERIATYDMVPADQKALPGRSTLTLGFPSMLEREVYHRIEPGVLEKALVSGVRPDDESVSEELFRSLRYDYFSQVTHLAVARAGDVAVGAEKGEKGSEASDTLFLSYDIRTDLKQPVGQTAIHLGRLITTEPLEAMAYASDFSPVKPLEVKEIPLEDHRESVHIWHWHSASDRLNYETSYSTTLRNQTYTALVDEHEMLGLGRRRSNVYFLRPVVASAIARMWMTWHTEDKNFMQRQLEGTKDSLVQSAFEGKRVRNAMHLASMLAQIGSEGAGSNAARFAEQRIVDQMYGAGNIDDYAELHVGIQRHRLSIWAGLAAMELLGLLKKEDANEILEYLRDTNALSLIVGTAHYS